MLITIRVHNVRVLDNDGKDLGPHCRAVGYMPGGQVLIEGRITGGHSPSCQGQAVKDVADWLRKHRAGWDIATLPGEGVVFYDESTRTQRRADGTEAEVL